MYFHQWAFVLWLCFGSVKFMLFPRKDCENDAQKCLVSKMKSTMELVAGAAKSKGK